MGTEVQSSDLSEAWAASLAALYPRLQDVSSASIGILDVSRAKLTLRRYFLQTQRSSDAGPSVSLQAQAQEARELLCRNGYDAEAYAVLRLAAESRMLDAQAQNLNALEVTGIAGVPDVLQALAAEVDALRSLATGVGFLDSTAPLPNLLKGVAKELLIAALRQRPASLAILRDWIDVAYSTETSEPILSLAVIRNTRRHFSELGLSNLTHLGVEHAARSSLRRRVHRELGKEEDRAGAGTDAAARQAEDLSASYARALRAQDKMEASTACDGDAESDDMVYSLDPEKEARPLLVDFIVNNLFRCKVGWYTEAGESFHDEEAHWQESFIYYMDTLITEIRSSQLFDLITDWPASMPALSDLKASLIETRMKVYVSAQLQASLEKRLLHPGARTRDILQLYVSLVYAVRYIDPSGVILSRIAGPIRRYLRSRSDTVPVIVASLLGDDEAFVHLRGELDAAGRNEVGGAANQADTSLGGGDRDEEEEDEQRLLGEGAISLTGPAPSKVIDYQDPNYEPQPIDAGPSYKQTRSADVIAMLVSIFDDKASFVKALEVSTAKALLKSEAYEVTREYRNNEILKRRFGDTSLARCDVMLQDVIDSRRVDSSVRQLLSTPLHHLTSPTKKKLPGDPATSGMTEEFRALKPLITSRHFWPDLEGTEVPHTAPMDASGGNKPVSLASIGPPPGGLDLKLPSKMGKAMDDYNRTFTALRDSRRLRWLAGYGRVTVSVEMKDGRSWTEVVNPIRAGVLYLAAEKAEQGEPLLVADVEREMNLPAGNRELEAAISYWCTRNVLAPVEGRKGWFVECELQPKQAQLPTSATT